jgi:hypothetical protein
MEPEPALQRRPGALLPFGVDPTREASTRIGVRCAVAGPDRVSISSRI